MVIRKLKYIIIKTNKGNIVFMPVIDEKYRERLIQIPSTIIANRNKTNIEILGIAGSSLGKKNWLTLDRTIYALSTIFKEDGLCAPINSEERMKFLTIQMINGKAEIIV